MLKDQELAQQILDSTTLAQQAVSGLIDVIKAEDYTLARTISNDLRELFTTLFRAGQQLSAEDKTVNLDNMCVNLLDSLNRLSGFITSNREKALHKIEFELVPLLQSAHLHFYFWGRVYPDPQRMKHYYEHEKKLLAANSYIEEAEKSGKYKYELTITVIGYNKLDYTKQCVESILRTVPQNLNYELILLNHGSTDGTKEYFESIKPTKQIDFKVNGTAGTVFPRIMEGEYMIGFSNDVIATKNAIENMLCCMKSDPQIGWGVPTTPNVSNLQTIPANYSTMAEMQDFAARNNRYDPFRHEQRARLCNPVTFSKSSVFVSALGFLGHFFTNGKASFPDDLISMFCRRNGYKSILAKDAYCFHFGSVTIKDDMRKINEQEAYTRGRQDFFRAFGVDPWGTGFCYDPNMLKLVELLTFEKINILGVNSGLGSNPLKIKEMYKEERHNLNAVVYNVTNQQNYVDDLRGVSDHVRYVKNINNTFAGSDEEFPSKFHHIVIDTPLNSFSDYMKLIKQCVKHLDDSGSLYSIMTKKGQELPFRKNFPNLSFNENWIRIKN